MRNDYLMDNSGVDDEVRELEDLLSVFRHDERDVLRLPDPEPVRDRAWKWALSFSFAGAAASVVIVAAAFFFVQHPTGGSTIGTRLTAKPGASLADPTVRMPEPQPADTAVRAVHVPIDRRLSRQKPPKRASRGKRARVIKVPGPPPLTNEERYAYEQLKLALAITSSKLQIVKDSINGIEDRQSASSDSRR